MMHGSLVGQVTSTPLPLTGAGGLSFAVDVEGCSLEILVTHELANKARRQVKPGCSVLVQVRDTSAHVLVAGAFEVLAPADHFMNLFTITGTVSAWPTEEEGEPQVQITVNNVMVTVIAPQYREWLASLRLDHMVYVMGTLSCNGAGLTLQAQRVERLLT